MDATHLPHAPQGLRSGEINKRSLFANHLRGLAAASVAVSHLLMSFWFGRDIVSRFTFTPPQAGPPPSIVLLVWHPWFNLGPFGVALFFLVSGFVIPNSLLQHSRLTFVAARLLRIFPTYMIALLLQVVLLQANAHYWNIPFAWSFSTVLRNFLLIYDLVPALSIDLVNWTLVLELHFYAFAALCAASIRRGSDLMPVLLGGAALAVNVLYWHGHAPSAYYVGQVGMNAMFFSFMLIGTLFNFHLRGRIGTVRLLGGIAALLATFLISWRFGPFADQFPVVPKNYVCALLLFGALYAVRRHVPRNRFLDAMAAISFPFYCLHALVGYSVLRFLMVGRGFGYPAVIAITVPILVALAWLLHRMVELPTARLGRRLQPARSAAAPAFGAVRLRPSR